MRRISWGYIAILILVLASIGWFLVARTQPEPTQLVPSSDNRSTYPETNQTASSTPDTSITTSTQSASSQALAYPISDALNRVTKKPFGILIHKKTSPVQPERFSGYHTGVDFETFPNEQDIDVPVYAVCNGPLLVKRRATGYGGIAIQRCTIKKETVTVIYGHLKLSSIETKIGDTLSAGTQVGILGKGYSEETDGERKHLHLGIHKGEAITLLGYVQESSQLSQWIDALTLIKK